MKKKESTKNSSRSTSSTAPSLSREDISAIIEVAAKSGVKVFRGAGLYLNFSSHQAISELPTPAVDHRGQNLEALKQDEEDLRAEQLRMLMIEDPVEYERQLRDGELSDEPGESDISG